MKRPHLEEGMSKNRFVRYCSCGAVLELNSPLIPTKWIDNEWKKAHPPNTDSHKPVNSKEEALKSKKKSQREERQREEFGCC